MRLHFSAVMERKRSNPSSPALFTRMVGRPNCSRTAATPFIDLPPVRDIDPQVHGRTARRHNFRRSRLGGLAVTVEDGDRVVVGGQPFADGEPDPRGPARHDGCSFETHWIGSFPCRVVRCMSRGEAAS